MVNFFPGWEGHGCVPTLTECGQKFTELYLGGEIEASQDGLDDFEVEFLCRCLAERVLKIYGWREDLSVEEFYEAAMMQRGLYLVSSPQFAHLVEETWSSWDVFKEGAKLWRR